MGSAYVGSTNRRSGDVRGRERVGACGTHGRSLSCARLCTHSPRANTSPCATGSGMPATGANLGANPITVASASTNPPPRPPFKTHKALRKRVIHPFQLGVYVISVRESFCLAVLDLSLLMRHWRMCMCILMRR